MNSLKLSYFNQVPKQKFKSSMKNDCQIIIRFPPESFIFLICLIFVIFSRIFIKCGEKVLFTISQWNPDITNPL